MAKGKLGKYAVVIVDYGDTCDGFPDVIGVFDTKREAVEDMLSDYRDMEAENDGYFESRYTTDTAELWLDSQHTQGSVWKVVAI